MRYGAIGFGKVLLFSVFLVIFVGGMVILNFKQKKLAKLTNILRDNPANEGVEHYVAAIRRMRIPKDPVFWGTVREAYEVVLSHGDIQPELKQQLRHVLQKKGAKWAE